MPVLVMPSLSVEEDSFDMQVYLLVIIFLMMKFNDEKSTIIYYHVGRDISAAPATGIKKQHKFEDKMTMSEALLGGNLVWPVKDEQGTPVFY